MTHPRRIQRRRTKGWRMPEGATYVGRPTKWGNPFTFKAAIEAGYTREGAVAAFEDWLAGNPWACPSHDDYESRRQAILARLPELRGKTLACWCKTCERHKDGLPLGEQCEDCEPCHADVLLRMANR